MVSGYINRIVCTQMKLISNGLEYYAEIKQNRPELPYLLMLHGFMGSGRVFEPLMNDLSDFCNPVTLDLAGHGRSTGSSNPDRYKTDLQLSDLKSIISRFRFSQLILYGYSMGGRLALQFVIQHTGFQGGLILESSSFGITGNTDRARRIETDNKRAEAIEKNFSEFLDQWQKLSLFTNDNGHESHKTLYNKVMKDQKPVNLAACLRGFGSGVMPPAIGKLHDINIPVLLLSGERDEKFISIHKQMESEFANAVARIIGGAAHRVHVDQPNLLIKEIEQFLKKLKL